jgi:hypothetical protein
MGDPGEPDSEALPAMPRERLAAHRSLDALPLDGPLCPRRESARLPEVPGMRL